MTGRIEWVVETLAVQPDEDLLEIGCGAGPFDATATRAGVRLAVTART